MELDLPREMLPRGNRSGLREMLPGFGEQMRAISLKHVPTAVLSRQTAGIRGSTLILNLPGSPRSIREILDEIFAAVPYCVDLIGGLTSLQSHLLSTHFGLLTLENDLE